jgi:hypothetical protein
MTQTLTPGQAQMVAGIEARTAARLEGKSPAFLAAYDRAVGSASGRVTGMATRTGGPGAPHGGPVSDQYLRAQHQRQVQAEVAQWHDQSTGTAMHVDGVSAESNPAAFLRKHGLVAIGNDGSEVEPSAGQARGLVGAYIDALQREAYSSSKGYTTISFRDPQVRGPAALVSARRVV